MKFHFICKKCYVSFAILILFFVILFFKATASVFPEIKSKNWKIISTKHFQIHYTKAPGAYVRRVKQILEKEFERVVYTFGKFPVSKVKVFVCNSKKEYDNLTGETIPGWGSAVSDPSKGIIILGSYRGSYSIIREELIHELAHIIVGAAVGEHFVPRWFYEGTAMWVSRKWGLIEKSDMRQAVLSGNLLSFDQIENLYKLSTINAPLAYSESFYAVRYLAKHYKKNVFYRLLEKMSHGKDFITAFHEATGITVKRFEREILTSARKQF